MTLMQPPTNAFTHIDPLEHVVAFVRGEGFGNGGGQLSVQLDDCRFRAGDQVFDVISSVTEQAVGNVEEICFRADLYDALLAFRIVLDELSFGVESRSLVGCHRGS